MSRQDNDRRKGGRRNNSSDDLSNYAMKSGKRRSWTVFEKITGRGKDDTLSDTPCYECFDTPVKCRSYSRRMNLRAKSRNVKREYYYEYNR